jgi:hypothetical protein
MGLNIVIKLCQKGKKLEDLNDKITARDMYMEAWNISSGYYEQCIAAHFVARLEESKESILEWNLKALELAAKVRKEKVDNFYPSLYFCVGLAYEKLQDYKNAKINFVYAREKVHTLSNDDYGKKLTINIEDSIKRMKTNV